MADVVIPEIGEMGMDVTFVAWLRNEGDVVEAGDPIFELDTEKVRLPVEAAVGGTLVDLRAQAGDVVMPQQVVARILIADEGKDAGKYTSTTEPHGAFPGTELSSRSRGDVPDHPAAAAAASPKARRLAAATGIDLALVAGTGPDGLITEPDVAAAVAAAGPKSPQEPRS